MCLYKCYRGGGSFSTFIDCWNDKEPRGYSISRIIGGIDQNIDCPAVPYDGSGIRKAFTDCKWDLIIIQQSSWYSYRYELWDKDHPGGHLLELLDIIRTYQPQAAIGINLVHASDKVRTMHKLGSDTDSLFHQIARSHKQFSTDYGIDLIIPYGTAIQNIRHSSINTTQYGFSGDEHHLAAGIGYYVAGAAYFEALIAHRYGVSIIGNPYRARVYDAPQKASPHPDELIPVTDENAYLCQKAAALAIHDMFNINNPDNISILTDRGSYTNNLQIENQNIIYTHTFDNTAWQALYVPFSLNYDDWKNDFEVAYIKGVRQLDKDNNGTLDEAIMDVVKIKSGFTTPNTPYLIRAKTTGKKTLSVKNSTLYAAKENSVDYGTAIAEYTFTGTYSAIPSASMIEKKYYVIVDGEFVISNGSNDLKPYRWYMKIEALNSSYVVSGTAKTIAINVIEDGMSGVRQLQIANDKLSVYDLNGRKVNENNLKPGIYVRNGKAFGVK